MKSVKESSSSNSEGRCFGRLKARELCPAEIESVSGGASYTGISEFRFTDDEGNAEFNYSDYTP